MIRTTELLRKYVLPGEPDVFTELAIGGNKILMTRNAVSSSAFIYRRFDAAGELASEVIIASDERSPVVGIFPVPALLTPKSIANNVYLKFKRPVILDQKSDAVFYTAMPIEIAVYRQSKDEEILLDAFSLRRQQYALYGSPERGVVCRYEEVEVSTTEDEIRPVPYEDALVRVAIRNDIANVVKISKVVVPMQNVILDHAHDDTWLPGSVEISLNQAFGSDVINVRLVHTKVKHSDKTSVERKEDSIAFLMDAGY